MILHTLNRVLTAAQSFEIDCLQVGKASLPDDVNRVESKQLKGSFVLQVSSAEDVSTPSKGALNTSKQRCNPA